jgi:hypothetical protein
LNVCEDDDDALLRFGIGPGDGDNTFLRNVGIYLRVYTEPTPRRIIPEVERWFYTVEESIQSQDSPKNKLHK